MESLVEVITLPLLATTFCLGGKKTKKKQVCFVSANLRQSIKKKKKKKKKKKITFLQ